MKITEKIARDIYTDATKNNLCSDKKAVIFYLKEALDYRLNLLKNNFSENTLHAIAVKTCNHPEVLKHIVNSGCGLEAASLEEVLLSKEAGAQNEMIVFDSPVKTREEILYCHQEIQGIHANANSIEELERYPADFNGTLGLRINPLVENSGGHFFNVSTPNSKFGVPISEKELIINSCLKHSKINCLHTHIGSNIKDFSSNVKAIKIVVELANRINEERSLKGIQNRIDTIDIGGGIDFDENNKAFSVESFSNSIAEIPGLFENFKLITEFGTFVHRMNSFVVSNIEYVLKNNDDLPELIYLHIGADMFVRKVYSDMKIDYPVSVLKLNSNSEGKTKTYDIVGPLCFAGDVLFKNVELNEVMEGDKLFIYNVGANTMSMWSGHCSRKQPDFLFV